MSKAICVDSLDPAMILELFCNGVYKVASKPIFVHNRHQIIQSNLQ